MSWHKIALVLKREYLYNFKRPSFLLTAFGIPVLSIVAMFLIIQFTANQETNLDGFATVGYIDRAGVVTDTANWERFRPVTAPGLTPPSEEGNGEAMQAYYDQLIEAANQQVLAGELPAYIVIGPQYILTGQVDVYSEKKIPAALTTEINDFLRDQLAASIPASIDAPAQRLAEPSDVTLRSLEGDDELSETELIGRLILPFVFVFIYFMATNTTAQFLMSGVVEEKENRLMEILATSIRPLDMLWGKLLGLGALSLTQIVLWLAGGGVILLLNSDAREAVSGLSFRPADVVLLVVLFVANFMLFSSVMLGIGASTTAETESRQVAGFFTFLNVLPIALLVTFMQNPNGILPMIFTFFPLTSAVGITLRIALTDVPTWQIALVLAIQLVSVAGVMWLAAKVFRLGMLMYGKALTPRAFWQAIRAGRVTLTTAPATAGTRQAASRPGRSLFRR